MPDVLETGSCGAAIDLDGGRCRLEGPWLFATLAEHDAMLSDADSGMDENFDRLDALIATGEPV